MSNRLGSLKRHLVGSALAGGLMLSLGLGCAVAQNQPSTADIVHALTPKPLTRSLSATRTPVATTNEDNRYISSLRHEKPRSLSLGEREKVAEIAKDKPKIDLEINFDFNSDRISKSAMPTVDSLAKALTDSAIKGSTFLVAGYTDGKGSGDYNQRLSERRANAVKHILVHRYGISADTLMTAGYGKTHLKNESDPLGAENRRVAIVNMASNVAGN